MKDLHKGDSCYIVGDGVSLKYFDLLSLPKKKVFALNLSIFHKEINQIGVDYAFMTSSYHFVPFIEKFSFLKTDFKHGVICNYYKKKFLKKPKSTFFLNLSNYLFTRNNNIYHLYKHLPKKNFQFVHDCLSVGESMCAGSLKYALSMAIYMGFKDIFLVGCDYTHENAMNGHWYERGRGKPIPHPNYNKRFFELASKYTNIVTVTPSGSGNILPSITYQELANKPLLYRENSEITDTGTLKIFSYWPDYMI